ncbi:MAG: hypothetical protein QG562_583 [Patescibacteria group bacterium]|nr:hypothetical protein [Patescibacteria group bacterium]
MIDPDLHTLVKLHAHDVAEALNAERNLQLGYDQTRGNLCHLLTYYVFERLKIEGLVARRELHMDANRVWHFLIAHSDANATPTESDIISDLNPWQGHYSGTGILHGSRSYVIDTLRTRGLPESHIALRGLKTIKVAHDLRLNPFSKFIDL